MTRPPARGRFDQRFRRTGWLVSRALRYPPNFWYLAIMGLILCLFSVVLFGTVTASLARDADTTIALEAQNIEESIFAFWRAQRSSAGSGPGNWESAPRTTFATEVGQGGLPGLLGAWAEKTGQMAGERPARVVSTRGKVLWTSPSFEQLALPLPEMPAGETLRQPTYHTMSAQGDRLRLVTYPALWGGRVLYLIQVATSLHELETSRMKLCLWLLILVPATLLVTAGLVTLLAMKTLWPLNRLAAHTQRFMAEYLHEHIEVPQGRHEVQHLSLMFSEMLLRVERAFRRLRQFSAAAAHELRTTLTVMKGDITVALRKPRETEEYRELLATYLDTLREMTTTVEELLQFAQLEAAEESIERAPVDLSRVAQEACAAFGPVMQEKSVQLRLAANGPVWVHGERHLLERVVTNLLDNAIKYTPPSGDISVHVGQSGNQACVAVHDSGPGIPAAELPNIFDRYFKPHAASDGTPSTGLGLGLCRWIVEAHHGRIEVVSAPGDGTTFTVWLPLRASV